MIGWLRRTWKRSKVAKASIVGAVGIPIIIIGSIGGTVILSPGSPSIPTVSPSMEICPGGASASTLQSPWSGASVPSNLKTGGGVTTYTSGQYADLPTFGSAGTDFPTATHGKIVATGDNSGTAQNPATNTVMWFAPGVHRGSTPAGQFDQIQMSAGEKVVGGYAGGVDASYTGQNANEFGFTNPSAASNITVEYMEISHLVNVGIFWDHRTNRDDQSWTITHNYFHDIGFDPSTGNGFKGQGTITYNCFDVIGQAGINFFADGTTISYNEFKDNGTQPDTGGTNAAMKGWETANAQMDHNYIHNMNNAYGLWLDTHNTGYHINDNFFAWNPGRAIELEIGENGLIENNTLIFNAFGNGGDGTLIMSAIDVNLSGGFPISGSNYNNSLTIQNNTLYDNWMGINIYAQGDRNCITAQPPGYCTINDKDSFSAATPNNDGGGVTTAACAVSCATVQSDYQYSLGDKIRFTSSGAYPYTITSIAAAGGQTAHPATGGPGNGKWTYGVTPNIGAVSNGATIYSQGTCPLLDTTSASSLSSFKTPANTGHGSQTTSYYDGCQWRVRNITVSGNTIHFDPNEIRTSTPPWPLTNYGGYTVIDLSKCYNGGAFLNAAVNPTWCGMNQMIGGLGTPGTPYNNSDPNWLSASLMSNSTFAAPLNNLDSTGNGGLGENAANNLWTNNTYDGSNIGFRAYFDTQSAVPSTSPPYSCGNAIAGFQPVCDVNVSGWASVWKQH